MVCWIVEMPGDEVDEFIGIGGIEVLREFSTRFNLGSRRRSQGRNPVGEPLDHR